MGSTSGAFISHMQFNVNNCCYFERFRSNRTQLSSVHAHNSRRPRLSLRSRRSNRTGVCFAVDDDLREKQQELASGGTGIGSALEDRPGKMMVKWLIRFGL